MEIPGGSRRSAPVGGSRGLRGHEHRGRSTMDRGARRTPRRPTRLPFRSLASERVANRAIRHRRVSADRGIVLLDAAASAPDGFRGRLIGIFLRPLHSGRDLAKRFLDPTLAAEIRHDRHHAALYASRLLGTWSNAPAYVDRYVFLWDTDRQCGTAAGLPPSSCAVIRHPF